MRTNMRQIVAAFLLLGWSATVAMAGPKIQVQRDPEFDFATLKTWTWNPSGPGEVKVVSRPIRSPSRSSAPTSR